MSCVSVFEENPDNVSELLNKMDEFEQFLIENDKESFLPFLRAYMTITEKVQNRIESFNSPEALEELDLEFGELYFDAMEAYFTEGEKRQPWRTYLNYVEREDSRPLLELLLGINAHINADLSILIDEMDYREEQDFQKVNRILLEALYPVILDTAVTRKDAESLAFIGSGPLPFIGLKKIIKWRQNAWDSKNKDKNEVLRSTERKASNLISLRHDKSLKGFLEKPSKILEA